MQSTSHLDSLRSIPSRPHSHGARSLRAAGALVASLFSGGAVLLMGASAPAQSHLFSFDGVKNGSLGERLGHAVTGVGDVDKDGHGDVLIGAPFGGTPNGGRAYLVSGKLGKLIRIHEGGEGGAQLGHAVSACGDVNGNGTVDYVIGSPNEYGGLGDARVIDGKTGAQLFSVFQDDPCGGPGVTCSVGTSVSGAGDVDGDGKPDVIIGAPNYKSHGLALVYSFFPTMKRLHRFEGTSVFTGVGKFVRGAGDVNNDGHSDVFVVGNNIAWLLSGKGGTLLFVREGTGATGLGDLNGDKHADYTVWDARKNIAVVYSGKTHKSMFPNGGNHACPAGDINKDGVPDVLIRFGAGMIRAHSGKDGTVLAVIKGSVMGAAGDVNGDGHADVLVGDPDRASKNGFAAVFSSKTLPLWTDEHQFSQANGGTQTLNIRAPAAYAGKSYWMFGSVSGTAPGVLLPGRVTVPLIVDFYTQHTISNPEFIVGGVGTLDATGSGKALFKVPKGFSTMLIGMAAHHAYVVFDDSGYYYMASNPVPALLVE